MLGGTTQACLPTKGGRVTCGCFDTDEWFNPGAPDEVMFGRPYDMPKLEKAAEMVFKQRTSIPLFLKRGSAEWEYIGNYRCIALLRDPALLEEKMKAHPKRGKITGILRFEKA